MTLIIAQARRREWTHWRQRTQSV